MSLTTKFMLAVLACSIVGVLHAQLPASEFARTDSFNSARISPDGKYLAIRAPAHDQTVLVVLEIDTGETESVIGFGRNRAVSSYWWVGNSRLLVTPAIQFNDYDEPVPTGDLVAVNADGSRKAFLFGQSAGDTVGSNIKRPERKPQYARVVAPLYDKSRRALVQIDDLRGRAGAPDRGTELALLDTQTGAYRSQGMSPRDVRSRYFATRDGDALLVLSGSDDFTGLVLHRRATVGDPWVEVTGLVIRGVSGVSNDGEAATLIAKGESGLDCVFTMALKTGEATQRACHDSADIEAVIRATDSGLPIAAIAYPGKPEWVAVDPDHRQAKLLRKIVGSFPEGTAVQPIDESDDGNRIVLLAYSDRDPGVYYLFDQRQKRISQLAVRRDWIDPETMARVEPFSFKARDGLTLHGYLTVPKGKTAEDLPLVVMPHGGPLGIRDYWGWDRDAQFMASRGYGVLQVNFRGSSGYGADFIDAGQRQWGGKMIDDITDAARWAIDQGHADPKRMCIFGGSYGGYAALMSAVREPDLYQCAIGFVGVYDLILQRSDTDITELRQGEAYYDVAVGATDKELRENSPITHIDKLKAPVLIIHGGQDKRVPLNQAQALRDALSRRKHPYEYYVESGEGHGFRNPENIAEFYTRIESFLGRHIGG